MGFLPRDAGSDVRDGQRRGVALGAEAAPMCIHAAALEGLDPVLSAVRLPARTPPADAAIVEPIPAVDGRSPGDGLPHAEGDDVVPAPSGRVDGVLVGSAHWIAP